MIHSYKINPYPINIVPKKQNFLKKVQKQQFIYCIFYAIDEKTSQMKECNYTEEELKLIISEKYTRIIDNASSISYNKKYYIPVDINTGEITAFTKGTKCTFIVNYDGEFYSEIESHYYQMMELENRDAILIRENKNNEIKKEHHKYIPPTDHPWRKNMMLKH